ncbi:MAG: hypothetical protein JNK38_09445 [Acidobacteria bacterium]|nr:hypothetical protein [Acidobacteriota bacterium]
MTKHQSVETQRRLQLQIAGAGVLLALMISAALWALPYPQTVHAAQTEAYFVLNVPPRNDEFVIKLTDPAKIQHARNLLRGAVTSPYQVQGKIIKQPASYNAPWSFHLDPQSIGFFDSSIEVCDGSIAYVETHLDEAGGDFLPGLAWCPWASRLVREIAPTVGGNEVTSVSAASYRRAGLAEESMVAAYGTNLALTTEIATQIPLPTKLAGTTVNITDKLGVERLAPLFFVSPTQVNYLIPAGIATGYVTVTIRNGNGTQSVERAQVLDFAPALLAANADGRGASVGLVLRLGEDGSVHLEPTAYFDPEQNKYVPKEIDLGAAGDQVFLVLFGTGLRNGDLTLSDLRIGDVPTELLYLGAQPDFEGLDQVNLRLPRELAGKGEVNVRLMVDDQKANPVTLKFK